MNRVRCTRISMPTPFLVGPVNVHLLCGDAAVLIDAGFDSPGGRDALESGLKRAKMKPKDLDAILITHGHLDHFGMAARLKEESGAEVWVHRSERLFLERYPASYERVLKRFLRYGRRHGFGEDEFEGMFRLYREYRSFGAPVTPDRYFKEGEKAVFGSLELEPIFSPGHTAGSTCLLDTGTGRLFTGDSVLEQITPVGAAGADDLVHHLGCLAQGSVQHVIGHETDGQRDATGAGQG